MAQVIPATDLDLHQVHEKFNLRPVWNGCSPLQGMPSLIKRPGYYCYFARSHWRITSLAIWRSGGGRMVPVGWAVAPRIF
jgi:hypothetical protein